MGTSPKIIRVVQNFDISQNLKGQKECIGMCLKGIPFLFLYVDHHFDVADCWLKELQTLGIGEIVIIAL